MQVELAEPGVPDQLHAALAGLPGIRETSLAGRTVSTRADDGATAVPALLAALDHAGIAVHGVTAARPSLDDVYLRFTGRRLADAEQPGANEPPASPPQADQPQADQPARCTSPAGGSR